MKTPIERGCRWLIGLGCLGLLALGGYKAVTWVTAGIDRASYSDPKYQRHLVHAASTGGLGGFVVAFLVLLILVPVIVRFVVGARD
ncbi:MAG TPA: hypothetical protein VNV87_07460 [Acidimicrobiales bacterium]|nr:hypothetical protein [Acidimicrobiales bacterium]